MSYKFRNDTMRKDVSKNKKNKSIVKVYESIAEDISDMIKDREEDGKLKLVLVMGRPGMTKSYIVEKIVNKMKKRYGIGGGTLAGEINDKKTLFMTLQAHSKDFVIILNDGERYIKKQSKMVSLINNAIEDRGVRLLQWQEAGDKNLKKSHEVRKTLFDGIMPQENEFKKKFEYRGVIVIVGNVKKEQIFEPILKKSHFYYLNFSNKQIVELIKMGKEKFYKKCPDFIKDDIIKFMEEHEDITGLNYDFRMYSSMLDVRMKEPDPEKLTEKIYTKYFP